MSTDEYEKKLAELTKTMDDLQKHTKDSGEALGKATSMFDEASAAKAESFKAYNELVKDQIDVLDAEETKVAEKFESMAHFAYVNRNVSLQRGKDNMAYEFKKVDCEIEMEENEAAIKKLEETLARSGEKSGGSEAK